jgi:hypothetical protein
MLKRKPKSKPQWVYHWRISGVEGNEDGYCLEDAVPDFVLLGMNEHSCDKVEYEVDEDRFMWKRELDRRKPDGNRRARTDD